MSSVVCFHSMCVHEIGICMHMCISVVVCMYVQYTRYGHVRDKFIAIKKNIYQTFTVVLPRWERWALMLQLPK